MRGMGHEPVDVNVGVGGVCHGEDGEAPQKCRTSRTAARRFRAAARHPSVSEEVLGREERKGVVAERGSGAAERAAWPLRRGHPWGVVGFEVA